MTLKFTAKVATLFVIFVALMVFSSMIQGVISEREYYQQDVVREVAQSTSYEQRVTGPILVLPYQLERFDEVIEKNKKQRKRSVINRVLYAIPHQLNVNAQADVSERRVGIYKAQVYANHLQFNGCFDGAEIEAIKLRKDFVSFGEPYLVTSISDTRGILKAPAMKLNGQLFEFKEGVKNDNFEKGIHAVINADVLNNKENVFEFSLDVQGTRNFSLVPLGRESTFSLKSNWPHPSFLGDILPQSRTVTEAGFEAQWESTWFATNINDHFGVNKVPDLNRISLPVFSVSMIETVNQYQLNQRSVKYAVLFISLTFVGFLIFELFSKLRIHPVQYTLVGFALVIFYLLLLALSEQIGFNYAYICAAIASSGLIGLYLSSVLKKFTRGFGFSLGLLLLYGVLYIILLSEDMALLLGSGLLFVVLAGLMLLTRKVDWYDLVQSLDVSAINMRTKKSDAVSSQVVGEEGKPTE